MARTVTHEAIVQLHSDIAAQHKGINGFYRFDVAELNNRFRSGVSTPVLMLESHSAELITNPNASTTFNQRALSFLLLDFGGAPDDYDKHNEVLDRLENIALDIAAYLKRLHEMKGHWLYGLLDINSFQYEKLGPLYDSMYGWNVLYSLKNKESMVFDAEKWELPG